MSCLSFRSCNRDEDAWLDQDMIEVERITSFLRPYPDALLEAVRAA